MRTVLMMVMIFAASDTFAGEWQRLPPLPDEQGFSKKVLRYDQKTEKWVESGELSAPRVTVPCVMWNKTWVVPSGESAVHRLRHTESSFAYAVYAPRAARWHPFPMRLTSTFGQSRRSEPTRIRLRMDLF